MSSSAALPAADFKVRGAGAGSQLARLVWLCVAGCLLAPLGAYVLGYGGRQEPFGSGWPLALALSGAGALATGLAGGRALQALVPLAFALPLLPLIAETLPFAADRVLLIGAGVGLCLRRALGPERFRRPARAPEDPDGEVRVPPGLIEGWLVPLFLGQTLACALAGFLNALPEGAPLVGTSLQIALRDSLLARPLIDATHGLERGWLRLEWLALLLACAVAARQTARSGARLARWAALALLLGLVVSLWEVRESCAFRGQSFASYFERGIPRNHRPLLDNNALGSAIGLLLPLAAAALIAARTRGARALGLLGALVGLLLLYSSRSKAALAGAALALVLMPVFYLGPRRLLARRSVAWTIALGALALLAVQLAPKPWLEPLERSRRGGDLLKVLRLDFAENYLRENRFAPWSAAWRLGLEQPLLGAGLGRLPRRMIEFRDPERQAEFNPYHENAHNQFLQSFAEEGLLGVCLLTGLFVAAIAGAARVARPVPGQDLLPPAADSEHSAERWAAAALAGGLSGLLVNSLASHSLLETTPALLFAGLSGSALGLAAKAQAMRRLARPNAAAPLGQGAAWARPSGPLRWGVPALGLLALWPATLKRPLLSSYSFGCYPWIERPDSVTGRDRLLAPDAWWYEALPPGSRLVWLVKDVRSWQFEQPLMVALEADAAPLIEARPIEHSRTPGKPNPVTYLKADLPADLARDRPVLWRLRAAPSWTNTLQFETGRQPAALRVTPLTAIERR